MGMRMWKEHFSVGIKLPLSVHAISTHWVHSETRGQSGRVQMQTSVANCHQQTAAAATITIRTTNTSTSIILNLATSCINGNLQEYITTRTQMEHACRCHHDHSVRSINRLANIIAINKTFDLMVFYTIYICILLLKYNQTRVVPNCQFDCIYPSLFSINQNGIN